jgi:DNA-binding NarL/FixJ family response regulator
MPPIRVLLVDNNPEFLKSASRFVQSHKAFDLVGDAKGGIEALEQIRKHTPDLVLIDWAMPELSGLESTRRIKAQPKAPRVIILTMYDSYEYRIAAFHAGADGFINKSDLGKQLFPLAQQLFEDMTVLQNWLNPPFGKNS